MAGPHKSLDDLEKNSLVVAMSALKRDLESLDSGLYLLWDGDSILPNPSQPELKSEDPIMKELDNVAAVVATDTDVVFQSAKELGLEGFSHIHRVPFVKGDSVYYLNCVVLTNPPYTSSKKFTYDPKGDDLFLLALDDKDKTYLQNYFFSAESFHVNGESEVVWM